MAWICVDLDDTLIQKGMPPEEDANPMMGEEGPQEENELPVDGAVEAMGQLTTEGHRLTVFTSRFNAMPDDRKQQLKEEIENQLMQLGFPPMEVWTGTHKPAADLFIDNNAITFDNDWGLALAQAQVMMEERGLVPGPQPDNGQLEPSPDDAEYPQESEGDLDANKA
jgi:hypothetical protein